MTPITTSAISFLAGVAVLGLVPVALGHGNDMEMGMEMGMGSGMNMSMGTGMNMTADSYPPTYFALEDHRAAIFGHISLMVLAWVFMLPAGKMEPPRLLLRWLSANVGSSQL